MNKNINTAEKLANSHILGITRSVKLEIIIEGKKISYYKHFQLQQSARKHHTFELELAYDSLEKAQNHNLEEAQQFLGKRITIIFKYKDVEHESPERAFVGVITEVVFEQQQGSLGNVILKGASPTILMDSAPHTQSFGGNKAVNTNIIANEIIKQTLSPPKFDIRIDTQSKSYINYSSQYNETHYNYLARLAETYGEQFYYDGETLHFGKLPPSKAPFQLVYGRNVNNIQVGLKAVYVKPEFFAYNSSNHTKMMSSIKGVKHVGNLSMKAYDLNENIFKNRSLTPAPINANMFLDVDDSLRSMAGSAAVEVFIVSGVTTVPFLYIGCVVDLEMRKPDTNQTSYFTRLMITEIFHEVNEKGYYKGSFEAIAEGTGFMPKPDFTIPSAGPQPATVISNTDPLNQGRIQVRFDWQTDTNTHFIRMMSPDAGGTGAVLQNRGFVAIPEVGEQVMIGFEYNNPDFPFAMGGMFHGKVAEGGGADNHIKSIQTRSGNRVIFNDKEGSILIGDASGNTYRMDGKGNMEVKAPQNITFTAGSNMEINVTSSLAFNIGINATITVPDLQQFIAGRIHTQAGKATISSENEVQIEGKETSVTGTKKLLMHSDEKAVVNSKGTVAMKGKEGNSQTNKPEKCKSSCEAAKKAEKKITVTFSLTASISTDTSGSTTLSLTTSVTIGPVHLTLTVDTTVKPKALKLNYNKELFTLDKQQLTTDKGVHFVPLTLTCNKPFDKNQDIKAIAVFENAEGEEEEEVVGKMTVIPADK